MLLSNFQEWQGLRRMIQCVLPEAAAAALWQRLQGFFARAESLGC